MITKSQIKHIRSLDDKKYRNECKQFVVEGDKMVKELLKSNFKVLELFSKNDWAAQNLSKKTYPFKITDVDQNRFQQMSSLSTAQDVLALVELPTLPLTPHYNIAIALDNIQDPGNLGSIIRIADWFGIDTILCNANTVDCFNPKVIRATMGSVFRVKCFYFDLQKYFSENKTPKRYAAVLDGKPLEKFSKIQEGIFLIGNESNGLQNELISLCEEKITISKLGSAESLNAAVASGIICHSLIKIS